MTDETVIILDPPGNASSFHHPHDEEEGPRCGLNPGSGDWTNVSHGEVPDEFGECKRCAELPKEPEEYQTILSRARHGTPEDFGLEPIPERRY